MARSGKPRAPWWARAGVALGTLILIPAGGALVAGRAHSAAPALDGPLNVLLVGIDPRGSHTAPLADTIILAHIPADRQNAYLFSLPRDLVVPIPAFPAAGVPAQRAKINAAMALGSRKPTGAYDPAQGFELLSKTVSDVTGIRDIDAGAIVNFAGFTRMVRALGGVRMVIDQDVVSEHRKPDGSPRDRIPDCRTGHNCLRPYTGAQKKYPKSEHPVRLSPWESLDFVRQRYGLPRSDYDRQRHQRQFLQAMTTRLLKKGVVADRDRLLTMLAVIGDSLTFTGSSHSVLSWAAELKHLDASKMIGIGLRGEALFEDGKYRGEQLPPYTTSFFQAVAEDRVGPFLLDHPGYVTLDDPVARKPS